MSDINLVIRYENGNLQVVTKEAEKEFKDSGKKSGRGFSKSFNNVLKKELQGPSDGIKSLTTAISAAGAAAAALSGVALFKGIEAAAVQEDAVNRLAGALRSSGEFSQEALQDFQDYAAGLQQISTVGDEVALEQLALAKSFGATNDQAKEIVSTAADLAQAFGTDLETQVRQISKTLGGYAGELGEVNPALKELTQEQLRNGEAVRVLSAQYAGQASNALNTFSGVAAQASNSFGDLFEEIGNVVTQNPAVIKGVRALTGIFGEAGAEVKSFGETFDVFDDALIPLTRFNDGVIKFVIAPLELALNVGNVFADTLIAGFARVVAGIGNVGFAIAKVLDSLGIGESLSEEFKTFEQTSEETANQLALNVNESLSKIGDFPLADNLATKNEELRTFFTQQRDIIAQETAITNAQQQEATDVLVETQTAQLQTISDVYGQITDEFKLNTQEATTATTKQIESANKSIAKFSQNTANALKNGIGNAAGSAFGEFGAALANGENAVDAFGKAFLKSIGQTLIQQGTAFILEGTAYAFSANPALQALAPGLISSGAAMATFGGFLGAAVGGSPSGGTSGAGPQGTPVEGGFVGEDTVDDGFVDGVAESTPQTVLNVNVEGNVVDQEAFIRNLAEQIGEEGGRQGIVFDNFATV